MIPARVFVETNFLFGVFRMPSERDRDALALQARFAAGEIKLSVPYVCFQEARHKIAKSLPSKRDSDIKNFHRFALANAAANWDFKEVEKLLDAARGEVNRTKAIYQREVAEFAGTLGDGVLHGKDEVFDFLESLALDHDLEFNDKLILSSVLCSAKALKASGADRLFFASVDKGDLQPTAQRPKLTRYYDEAGVVFLPNFVLPDPPVTAS